MAKSRRWGTCTRPTLFCDPYWRGTVLACKNRCFESLEMLRNFCWTCSSPIPTGTVSTASHQTHILLGQQLRWLLRVSLGNMNHWRLRKRSYLRPFHNEVMIEIFNRFSRKNAAIFSSYPPQTNPDPEIFSTTSNRPQFLLELCVALALPSSAMLHWQHELHQIRNDWNHGFRNAFRTHNALKCHCTTRVQKWTHAISCYHLLNS